MAATLDQRIERLTEAYAESDREVRESVEEKVTAAALALDDYAAAERIWLVSPTSKDLQAAANEARQNLGNKRGALTQALTAARATADAANNATWDEVRAPGWDGPAAVEPAEPEPPPEPT